jgi:hypothetical protein
MAYPAGPYPPTSYPYPVSVAPAPYGLGAPVARPGRTPLIVLSVLVGVLAVALILVGVLFLQQRSETTKSNQAVADAHAAVDSLNRQLAAAKADRDTALSDVDKYKTQLAACVQDTSDLFNAADQTALAAAAAKMRTDCRNTV